MYIFNMQGRKDIQPKMLYQVDISDRVPVDNFTGSWVVQYILYCIYEKTAKYYGIVGQESIDPLVFFKICLAAYLNNINSDCRLIAYWSNCLDIRLYLKYDIDEPLPFRHIKSSHEWHSMKASGSNNSKCKNCPLRSSCFGKSEFKKIAHSIYKPENDVIHENLKTPYARKIFKKRGGTVEPVLGKMLNFLNLKRVNPLRI